MKIKMTSRSDYKKKILSLPLLADNRELIAHLVEELSCVPYYEDHTTLKILQSALSAKQGSSPRSSEDRPKYLWNELQTICNNGKWEEFERRFLSVEIKRMHKNVGKILESAFWDRLSTETQQICDEINAGGNHISQAREIHDALMADGGLMLPGGGRVPLTFAPEHFKQLLHFTTSKFRRWEKQNFLPLLHRIDGGAKGPFDLNLDITQSEEHPRISEEKNKDAVIGVQNKMIVNLRDEARGLRTKLVLSAKFAARPAKESLQQLADACRKKNGSINYSALGKKIGKSNHTARTWCRSYHIS